MKISNKAIKGSNNHLNIFICFSKNIVKIYNEVKGPKQGKHIKKSMIWNKSHEKYKPSG